MFGTAVEVSDRERVRSSREKFEVTRDIFAYGYSVELSFSVNIEWTAYFREIGVCLKSGRESALLPEYKHLGKRKLLRGGDPGW
ncbi:hypothetical protein R1sor_001553 [Riccia sorocarpa]|uniref:Uncharacterized protein n=1 Tax=Riccia sorocarpa TaxID=122646 RepID=A0ABD3H0F1_9MARC